MTQASVLAQLGSAGVSQGFKNRIINGAMVIDQRNAGASVNGNNNYTLDRWQALVSASSKFTVQQNAGSVTPPAGFTNYLGVTSSSAYSVSSSDYFTINQRIEGFNVADLGWGTANAKTVTFSFWVRSSLTGTFGGSFRNSASNRSYPYTYTISAANTWEYKTITIAGDTSGTWLTTNGIGVDINFNLGAGASFSGTAGAWNGNNNFSATGATSVVGTNGATFYITGVQLEVGTTATEFEVRPYGAELALCQRYFERLGSSSSSYGLPTGYTYQSAGINYLYFPGIPLLVEKRAAPTLTFTSGNTTFFNGIYGTSNTGATLDATMTGSLNATTTTTRTIGFYQNTTSTSGANAGSALLGSINQNQFVSVSAEL